MIAPDMATMLGFMFTDASLPAGVLQSLLDEAVDGAFISITVVGDTSTSDTVLLAATGRAGNPPIVDAGSDDLLEFRQALARVSLELAHLVIRDGEGAQKFIAIEVRGAVSGLSARRIALTIANSPLVKTAFAGGDANWGRIIMAVGKADEPVDGSAISVSFGGYTVARNGGAVPDLDEGPVDEHLAGQEIEVVVEVGDGPGASIVWTCDLTHAYIDINADYRS
jgi:glutamate N-acetyltransferase/amino-acid N-acetyltransferase